MSRDRRRKLFLLLCAGCVVSMIAYGLIVARRYRNPPVSQAAPPPRAVGSEVEPDNGPGPAPQPALPSTPPATAESAAGGREIAPATTPAVESPPSARAKPAPDRPAPQPKQAQEPAKQGQERAAATSGESAAVAPGRLVALNLRPSAELGTVEISPLDALEDRKATSLHCERIYFAAGKGICLTREIKLFSAQTIATLVDARFQPLSSVRLDGIPSRARISPDGRYGAFTVFVSGHSYADTSLSTATLLLDMKTGSTLANLESFKVFRDGDRIESPDFNYWGVTFLHDSNAFYATLRTGGVNYLVRGDIGARSVRILYKGVECPSVSPDETRIAFKKMVSPGSWRLTVLNLSTFQETALAEIRSVDDQAEWLDDNHVLYGMVPAKTPPFMNILVVAADGSGDAQVFAPGAGSPAVVR